MKHQVDFNGYLQIPPASYVFEVFFRKNTRIRLKAGLRGEVSEWLRSYV